MSRRSLPSSHLQPTWYILSLSFTYWSIVSYTLTHIPELSSICSRAQAFSSSLHMAGISPYIDTNNPVYMELASQWASTNQVESVDLCALWQWFIFLYSKHRRVHLHLPRWLHMMLSYSLLLHINSMLNPPLQCYKPLLHTMQVPSWSESGKLVKINFLISVQLIDKLAVSLTVYVLQNTSSVLQAMLILLIEVKNERRWEREREVRESVCVWERGMEALLLYPCSLSAFEFQCVCDVCDPYLDMFVLCIHMFCLSLLYRWSTDYIMGCLWCQLTGFCHS